MTKSLINAQKVIELKESIAKWQQMGIDLSKSMPPDMQAGFLLWMGATLAIFNSMVALIVESE